MSDIQGSQMADQTSPRIATVLMIATYVAGTAGIVWGFATVLADPPSLSGGTVLAVGVAGFLSFLRHSVFHRSDAVRMGWDTGQRNNFQIEVGLANLAWAVLAVLAVVLNWGLAAQAASFLVFGFYLVFVGIMMATAPRDAQARPWGPMISLGLFGVALCVVGFLGMTAVTR